MTERHVVTALAAKRAEMAGLVAEAEGRLEALRADLGHGDAVLRLFDPDAEPETIRTKRPRTGRSGPATAKPSRPVIGTFRTADRPLTAMGLAKKVLENAGNGGDEVTETVLARTIGKRLDHHRGARCGRQPRCWRAYASVARANGHVSTVTEWAG